MKKVESGSCLISKIVTLLASALVFGCAPSTSKMAAQTYLSPTDAIRAAGALGASTGSNGWKCPSSPNVNLKDGIGFNGTDYFNNNFTVCVSTTNASEFKIDGSATSGALCIYPMQAGYSASTGQYASSPVLADNPQCFALNGQSIVVTFSASTEINYMSIVDANFTQAFNKCLSSTSPCPAHSEGFVK